MDKNRKHGTAIEWTHANGYKGETWNPVVGCSKVSTGCRECYAEQVHRLRLNGKHGYPEWMPWTMLNAAHNVTLMPHKLDQPLRWRAPRMVFTNSMSDLFHEQIPDKYIARVFAVMAQARRHVFQTLTKRPDRMRELLTNEAWWAGVGQVLIEDYGLTPWEVDALLTSDSTSTYISNAWIGASIESRKWVGRADDLRATPAAVRFISAEPLLGSLTDCRCGHSVSSHGRHSGLCGVEGCRCESTRDALDLFAIDWVIAGGESGPNHRPLDVQWMRDLRDACEREGVAYFTKQMGGVRPGTALDDLPEDLRIRQMPLVVTHA